MPNLTNGWTEIPPKFHRNFGHKFQTKFNRRGSGGGAPSVPRGCGGAGAPPARVICQNLQKCLHKKPKYQVGNHTVYRQPDA